MLGIDYDVNSVKIVELDAANKLSNWSSDVISPEGPENSLEKVLAGKVKSHKFKALQAVVAVSAPEMVYQLIELPVIPDNEVRDAIHYKLEPTLPFSVNDAVICYRKITGVTGAGKEFFIVAALPGRQVREIISSLHKAGLIIKDIIPAACAVKDVPGLPADEPFAVVNFNRFTTLIVMIKNNETVFAREVKLGGEELTHALIGENIDHARAAEIVGRYGIPLGFEEYAKETGLLAEDILGKIKPILEKIEVEITRTFDYYRERTTDQTEFKLIYFTGESSSVKNLVAFFQGGGFGARVEPLAIKVKTTEPAPVEMSALALALGAAQLLKQTISLLPEEYKSVYYNLKKRLFNFWTLSLVYFLALAIVLGINYYFFSGLVIKKRSLLRQLEQKGLTFKQKGYQNTVLKKVEKELGYRPGNTDRFVKILGHFHRSAPDNVFLEQMTYENRGNKLLVKGIMVRSADNTEVSMMVERLKRNRLFLTIDLSDLRETDRFSVPAYEFEIRCTLGE